MAKIAAVVVTYNRKELLKENIEALKAQISDEPLDIIIIDNASTDGTRDFIEEYVSSGDVIYLNTGANLGGAGGFCYGMKWACEHGYEFCWVMDDDCIPHRDALSSFVEYEAAHHGEYGFLSSRILWKDGSLCRMNVQRETMYRNVRSWDRDVIPVAMASFVSLWVPTARIYEEGLPIKEFFIWTDDWEFTRRLSRKYPCYVITDNVCTHKCASNTGAEISGAGEDRLGRFRYLYRNDVYLYRREGLKGFGYEAVRLTSHVLRVLTKSRNNRIKRIGIIISSTSEGLRFRPEIEYPSTDIKMEE